MSQKLFIATLISAFLLFGFSVVADPTTIAPPSTLTPDITPRRLRRLRGSEAIAHDDVAQAHPPREARNIVSTEVFDRGDLGLVGTIPDHPSLRHTAVSNNSPTELVPTFEEKDQSSEQPKEEKREATHLA